MEFLTNLRFALGQMRKRWALTLAAAFSLALCIGLNTGIFSVFNAALLRPIPFSEPDRLVEIFNSYPTVGFDKESSGIELYTVYKEQVEAIDGFALVHEESVNVGGTDHAQRLKGLRVSPDFFSTMRLAPALGQVFHSAHGLPGNDKVVILTHGFWKSAFDGDPGVVGTEILIDSRLHTVLGVLPASFRRYEEEVRVILPYSWNPAAVDLSNRHDNYATLLGRLADDASIALAQAQVDAIDASFREANPFHADVLAASGHRSLVKVHQEERIKAVRGTITLLQAFALAILIIGTLNIANLRLAEVIGRERELTLRLVIGGSRGAILRQLLTEAGLLGVLGGALGLLTAWLSLSLVRSSFAGIVRDAASITLDGTVLLWALTLIVTTILIVGLSPARLLWRLNYQTVLQDGGRGSAGRGTALRSSLGMIQTGLAVLLLIATGLFVRSFWNVTAVSPGFDMERISTFRTSLPTATYPDTVARSTVVRRVLDQLRALPGVEQAAGASMVPAVTEVTSHRALWIRGDETSEDQPQKLAYNFPITEDFFETLGISLLEGRDIEVTDTEETPEVYVVDKYFGDRYIPDGALGGRFSFSGPQENDEDWATVVGEVSPIIVGKLAEPGSRPVAYRSYYQWSTAEVSFFMRSERFHESLLADARRVIDAIDPQLPFYRTGRLDRMIEESLLERRGILGLTLLFALVAVLLAGAGIYGIQAYNAHADRRTLAIMAALGATPARLLRRTLGRALVPVGGGLLVGIVAAIVLAPSVAELLFSVEPRDPLTFVLVSLFVLLVSIGVLFFPARAAARTVPGKILKEE